MPFARSCIPAVLTIRSGLHAGVSLSLGRETSIGQSPANEVCLLDDGILDRHVLLTLDRSGFTVAPLAGDVAVNGALQEAPQSHRLAPGRSIELAFGPVVASLERGPRKRFGAGYLMGLTIMLAVGILPVPWRGATQSEALAQRAPVAERPVAAAPVDMQEFARSVTARFADMGLDRTMQIEVNGADGRPVSTSVTGVVEPQDLDDFQAFLAWYDAQPGRPALFNMTSRQLPKDQELPRIASVLLQPVPGLITDTGSHVRVGEQLPGGWTLTSVDTEAVVLTLGGQSRVILLGSSKATSAP